MKKSHISQLTQRQKENIADHYTKQYKELISIMKKSFAEIIIRTDFLALVFLTDIWGAMSKHTVDKLKQKEDGNDDIDLSKIKTIGRC